MSNLMIFEEGNLLNHTDKCYGKDSLASNRKDSDNSIECQVNIPLISPQSTLHDKPFKLKPESSLPTETLNLLTFLQSYADNKSAFNPFVSVLQTDENIQSNNKRQSTNPFLEDVNKCQEDANYLSPEMFMQIWETNLRLQIQITTIFNVLMAKLDSISKKDTTYLSKNSIKENYEKRLLYASELLESIIIEDDISPLLASKALTKCKNMSIDARSNRSNDIFTSSFLNNSATARPLGINDNSMRTALLECLKEVDKMDNIAKNSTSQAPPSNFSYLRQDAGAFPHSSIMNYSQIEPSIFSYQNGFSSNKDYLYSPLSEQCDQMNGNEPNETNPFKLLLKLKDSNTTHKNQEENTNINFEKYCSISNTNVTKNHFEITNIDDHKSTIKHDYTSSSKMSSLNPFSPELVPLVQKDSLPLFQNTQNDDTKHVTPNISCENFGISLNPDHNYFNTFSTTFNNNNANKLVKYNEELLWSNGSDYLSTSHIFEKLDEVNMEEAKIKNSQESPNIFTKAWIKDAKNTLLSEVQIHNKSDVQTSINISVPQMLHKSQQFQTHMDSSYYTTFDPGLTFSSNEDYIKDNTSYSNCSQKNNIDFQTYSEEVKINTDMNNLDYKGQSIKNDDTTTVNMINSSKDVELYTPYYEFLISTATGFAKLFLQTIEIKNKTFCIFHFQDEGWLLVDNFVEAFTTYGTISEYYKQLQINHITMIKEIDRSESPTLFVQLDKMSLNLSSDYTNKVNKIHLMPLKSVAPILEKLHIITRTEINNVFTKKEFAQCPLLHKLQILVRTYGQLRNIILKKLTSTTT